MVIVGPISHHPLRVDAMRKNALVVGDMRNAVRGSEWQTAQFVYKPCHSQPGSNNKFHVPYFEYSRKPDSKLLACTIRILPIIILLLPLNRCLPNRNAVFS